ncbi:MAG: ribulokinase [Opitutaceae bacterium]
MPPTSRSPFALGLDFGTNSVRALVARCSDGAEIGAATAGYRSGEQGVLLDPRDHQLARQHPGDYTAALERSVRGALAAAARHRGFRPDRLVGIGVAATGSSPFPVDRRNRPLALDPRWRRNPDAQCWLWKDHTSWREAARITELAARHRPRYLARTGGAYSSEWWWSKILHCLNVAPRVFEAAHSWVELADWVPAALAGVDSPEAIVRGICAAGHKAMYADDWSGLPDAEFLAKLDPRLAALRGRLYSKAYDASRAAGALAPRWARRLGLPAGLPIAIGQFDVHYGALACGVREGTLVKVIGTSTCDTAVVAASRSTLDIPGLCGMVPGSILPGWIGVEAGQSAVGDIFKWWVEGVCAGGPGEYHAQMEAAARAKPGSSGLLALDWHNGNRTILVDPLLTGLLLGCTLHTTRAEIYRALIEATAFGARVIVERLREHGVRVDRVVCAGGVAEKNPLLMRIYADVIGCPMEAAASSQACALGAAIAAAVLAGAFADIPAAQRAMVRAPARRYRPDPGRRRTYDRLHRLYRRLHDGFGGVGGPADFSRVMKDLLKIKFEGTKPRRT